MLEEAGAGAEAEADGAGDNLAAEWRVIALFYT